ncbi:MAG TPA: hypothetical protein VEX68_23065, partial [Bryobacteraceae bacterium]|nr:hypothetical protein [Bryobacteraceae bacterium]
SYDLVTNPRSLLVPVRVLIGGVNGNVLYAGLVGMGLWQFNIQIPSELAPGDHPVVVELLGTSTYSQGGVILPVRD